jgi:hypothetical protein
MSNPQTAQNGQTAKQYPVSLILFSEYEFDARGRQALARPVQIGSVWPRKEAGKGNIIKWDIKLRDIYNGVTFEVPYTPKAKDQEQAIEDALASAQGDNGANDFDPQSPF